MRWYYVDNISKKQLGPFRDAQLYQLLENKTITRETFVWNGDTVKDWTRVMAVEGLDERSRSLRHERLKPQWSGGRSQSKQKLAVGDKLVVYDTTHNRESAEVVKVLDDEIKIHYLGWGSKWDEWLPTTSPRIYQVNGKSRQKSSRRKPSKRNSVSIKIISASAEDKPVPKPGHKKKKKSSQKSISLSLIGSRPEDYTMFYPNLEQTPRNSYSQDEIEIHKPSEYRKQAQQEAEKLVQERLNIEKERNTFVKVKEELQASLTEAKPVDAAKLMDSIEKFRLERMRLQAEYNDRATELSSLKEALYKREQKDKSQKNVHEKMNARIAELENMFKKREAKIRQREENITLRARQVDAYNIDSARTKLIQKEISSAAETIQALEDAHSKNIGKALSIQQHDTKALGDLRDMKEKMHEEREKLKRDRARVLQGLNKVHIAKNQLLEANQLLEEEESKNITWSEELKKQAAENTAKNEEDAVAFVKQKKRLNAKMEKLEKLKTTIANDNAELKALTINQIAQLKKKFGSAHLNIKREEESIKRLHTDLNQKAMELAARDRQLTQDLRNAELQQKKLMKSTQNDQQRVVYQLSSRVKELETQLSQLKHEKEILITPLNISKDDRAITQNKLAKLLEELETEKTKRNRQSGELLECKNTIESMKGQKLKHQVERDVWHSITERISGERDTLKDEQEGLREKAKELRQQLKVLQKKLGAEQETNIVESIYKHNRKVSMMSLQPIQPNAALENGKDSPVDDPYGTRTTSNFDNLLRTIMDSHQTLVKNEEQVKKSMKNCMDELNIGEDVMLENSDEDYEDGEYDDDYEESEGEEGVIQPPALHHDRNESSEFFQDV